MKLEAEGFILLIS